MYTCEHISHKHFIRQPVNECTRRVVGLENVVDRLRQLETRPLGVEVFHEHRAACLGGSGRDGGALDVNAKDAERVRRRPPEALVVLEHHQPLENASYHIISYSFHMIQRQSEAEHGWYKKYICEMRY